MKTPFSYIIAFSIWFLFSGSAASASPGTEVKKQAEEMAQALLKHDYEKFASFVYPDILYLMGGKDEMIQTIKDGQNAMNEQGYGLMSILISEPSEMIDTAGELQCTIKQTMEMKAPGGRLVSLSTLVAVSKDSGKTWFFIDASNTDDIRIKSVIKRMSSKIIIPEPMKPTYLKD